MNAEDTTATVTLRLPTAEPSHEGEPAPALLELAGLEIGLRRSLGATRGQIRGQFVAESLLLSLIGGTGGVLLGTTITALYAVKRMAHRRATLGGPHGTVNAGSPRAASGAATPRHDTTAAAGAEPPGRLAAYRRGRFS